MGNLQKYTPMAKVLTYDNEVYYIQESQQEALEKMINENPFGICKLNGISVKYKDIKKIMPHKSLGYEDLPIHQRTEVEGMIKRFQENLGYYPKEANIKKMIEKVTSKL